MCIATFPVILDFLSHRALFLWWHCSAVFFSPQYKYMKGLGSLVNILISTSKFVNYSFGTVILLNHFVFQVNVSVWNVQYFIWMCHRYFEIEGQNFDVHAMLSVPIRKERISSWVQKLEVVDHITLRLNVTTTESHFFVLFVHLSAKLEEKSKLW